MFEFKYLTLLLAPFAPHIAEQFWRFLGGTGSVHDQSWPNYDSSALIEESYKLMRFSILIMTIYILKGTK